MFQDGLEYRTINTARSALSNFHDKIDDYKVGKHPTVCELLSGVFNLRSPQPRYNFIWDINVVLTYLKSLPENDHLSDQQLTQKLTTLLALTSGSRNHEIHHLDVRFMAISEEIVIFRFSKLTKTWKKGQCPPKLLFKAFPEDCKLCVVHCLNEYLPAF